MFAKKNLLIAFLVTFLLLSGVAIAYGDGVNTEGETTHEIPIFGEVRADSSLLVLTLVIAFIDGFNPCSLWVLTFLIGVVIFAGRKKLLLVGLTFLIVTATIYGLFIAGALSVFQYVAHLFWIRLVVAGVAITFAAVNIKDFFWHGKGPSISLPSKYKPGVFKKVRGLMDRDNPLIVMGATAVMAAGIALVELPCTAGFPIVWSHIVAQRQLAMMVYVTLLVIYVLVYLSVELAIYLTAVWRMKSIDLEKEKGRVLTLIGGYIMLMLGSILIVDHTLMENIGLTLVAFAAAIVAALVTAKLHKKYAKGGGATDFTCKGCEVMEDTYGDDEDEEKK